MEFSNSLKTDSPVINCVDIYWVDLDCPRVVMDCLVKLSQLGQAVPSVI